MITIIKFRYLIYKTYTCEKKEKENHIMVCPAYALLLLRINRPNIDEFNLRLSAPML